MEAPAPQHVRGYAVCSAPRCGTNFLRFLLTSTGRLGKPVEFFNTQARRMDGIPDYPDDPHLQLKRVLSSGMTPNGVYGLKIFPYQFERAINTEWPDVLPNLSFIHLERDDLLGQAISMVKADQTDQWRTGHPAKGEVRYDPVAITTSLRKAVAAQVRWRFWFARTGIQPLKLRYEQVMADPQAAVDAIAALVGLEERPRVDPAGIEIGIQRNAESEEWRARFIRDCGKRSRF